MAKIFFGVPAISAQIERVFRNEGNILKPKHHVWLVPKNFKQLIFLVINFNL